MTEKKNTASTSGNCNEDSFADMFSACQQPSARITVGEVVDGKVISIGKENAFLDLGTRAEGMIDKEEFMFKGRLTIQEGDTIQVLVNSFRNGIFQCSSRGQAAVRSDGHQPKDDSAKLLLLDAFSRRLPVEGKVKAVNKGGFEVQILGQRAFCPISQIERNYCQNPEVHLEKTYAFMVMQYEEDGRNIVVGRKELLLDDERKKAQLLWQALAVGQVHEGTVTSVHEYGAFIDIGGSEGLLHVSEISFKKIADAREALQSGQKLQVAIIQLDREKNKISLSLKALQTDPWIEAAEKLAVGSELSGVVVALKNFGAFVELFPGLVGLLHVSQLGASRRVSHAKEILAIGQSVNVRVLAVDPVQKTISLTMEEAKVDYSDELVRLKENQEKDLKNSTTMAALLDSAIKGKKN